MPIEVSGAGAFGDSEEVAELALLLRALADPQDAVALVGVLRGPLFGLSDRDLFAYKQGGGWFGIFNGARTDDSPMPGGDPQDWAGGLHLPPSHEASADRRSPGGGGQAEDRSSTAVGDALRSLHQYWKWTRVLPVGAALDRILEHSGYLALAATSPDGGEAGDLLHAVDWVRLVVEDGGSLADAAISLEDDAESSGDVESLPLEPGRTDVVRLMNLHKAKGLEADVVFLADPCGGVRKGVSRRIVRSGDGAKGWFQIERPGEGGKPGMVVAKPKGWDDHATIEKGFTAAEETRLLYVASTRAKQMLVVCRYAKVGQSRPWGALDASLGRRPSSSFPLLRSCREPRQWISHRREGRGAQRARQG